MSEDRLTGAPDELVFMVAGDDDNGDHLIFVTHDKDRAEARHRVMLAEFTNVKANWMEKN